MKSKLSNVQKFLARLILVTMISVPFSSAIAADWEGGQGGDLWNVAANWWPDVPTITDDVVLQAWPYQGPIIDETVEAFCRRLDGPAAGPGGAQIMNITGGSLTIGAAAGDYWRIPFEYGQGPAEVVISGGDISVFDYMFIGRRAEAVVNMSGGTLSTGRGGLDIGRDRADETFFGHGTLNLSGGTINTTTYFGLGNQGEGYLNMSGGTINVGSTFNFANGGKGRLHITDGTINVGTSLRSAYTNASADGEITMDGGTIHIGTWARVGETSTMNWIMNDGQLTTGEFLRIGHDSGMGYFELNGGQVDLRDLRMCEHFSDGRTGTGVFVMTGGTVNISADVRMAVGRAAAYGEIIMDDGEFNIGSWIRVGETGDAQWIMNGGELNIGEFLRMGHNDGSSGYFELNGGTVTIGRAGRPDDFEIRYGSMNITDGTLIIRSNAVDEVEQYFLSGALQAFGGHGTIHIAYDEVLEQTTVTAEGSYYQAGLISPRGVIEPAGIELQWLPGIEATESVLYFGQNYELVSSGDASVYVDTFPVSVTSYVVGDLELDTQYYWRVDSVQPGHPDSPWVGAVWGVQTTNGFSIDNFFNDYDDENLLSAVWNAGGGASIRVSAEDEPSQGAASMRVEYSGASSVKRTFDQAQDWDYYGQIKALSVNVWGRHPDGGFDPYPLTLSVTLTDWSNSSDTVAFEVGLTPTAWQTGHIALSEFSGINLGQIKSIALSINQGSGVVYIDNISIWGVRCVPAFAVGDLTGDCIAGVEDLLFFADEWLRQDYTAYAESIAGNLLVHYTFDELGFGGVAVPDVSGNGYDAYLPEPDAWSEGSIDFDGSFFVDILDAEGLFSNVDQEITISMWAESYFTSPITFDTVVFYGGTEPDMQVHRLSFFLPYQTTGTTNYDRLMFTGGRLSGPDGLIMENMTVPVMPEDYAGQLNHYAWTKNAVTGRIKLYINGVLRAEGREYFNSMSGVTRFSLGGSYQNRWYWQGKLEDFRIYNRELSHGEILTLAGQDGIFTPLDSPANLSTDGEHQIVDFNDFVLMSQHWLEEQLWP